MSSSCHPSACLNQLIELMYVDLLLFNDDLVSILHNVWQQTRDNKQKTNTQQSDYLWLLVKQRPKGTMKTGWVTPWSTIPVRSQRWATMHPSHALQDHKLVEDGLPPPRPVVSACPSERAQGVKVLSTEHMLQKLTAFNHKWDTAKPSTEPCLISTDATALCPSTDHLRSAKIVRREVMLSKLSVEATDWREMAPYLRMTVHPKLWGPWRIRKYLPRNSKKPQEPPHPSQVQRP